MKAFTKKVAVFALLAICLAFNVPAATIYYTLHLTDNCPGTWLGNYTVRQSVYMDGVLKCTSTVTLSYDQVNGPHNFECPNLPLDAENPVYEIVIEICRVTTPPCSCRGHSGSGLIYYDNLDDYLDIYVTIDD